MLDLPESLVAKIEDLAREFGVERMILYGSRARGDARPSSDIDLAVLGGPSGVKKGSLAADVDELPTLLKIYLLFTDESIEPGLKERIEHEGVTIYERPNNKV